MISSNHLSEISLDEAKKIQLELREKITLIDTIENHDSVRLVGGADVGFLKSDGDTLSALAGIVIYDRTRGEITEQVFAAVPITLPYIPGFLSFREGPAILKALAELSGLPGVMMYDGCGIAHPRGFGLASHMAVLTEIPSIGCAKSRLCGWCDEPGVNKGDWSVLTYKDTPVGACLRTRTNVKPVFISPGSGFSIESARKFVLACTGKYRIPEPTRLAHQFVTAEKKRILARCNQFR